jgi:hypothetical protein
VVSIGYLIDDSVTFYIIDLASFVLVLLLTVLAVEWAIDNG